MRRRRFAPTRTGSVVSMKSVRKALAGLCAVVMVGMVPPPALSETTGGLFAAVNGNIGNHAGSLYRYAPDGAQVTLASGLSRPRGLAFDSGRNLFLATNDCKRICNATIVKLRPGGEQSVFGAIGGLFAQGMAIDRSDNVFVMADTDNSRRSLIFKFAPDGRKTLFGTVPGQAGGLAFDTAGNLFAASPTEQTIYKFAPLDGESSVFAGSEAFGEKGPMGLAFDRFGNLFVTVSGFPFTDDTILKFDPSGAKSIFATGLKHPRGLVFDGAGDLYVAEWPLFEPGSIRKITSDGVSTLFASGIGSSRSGGPTWLAVEP